MASGETPQAQFKGLAYGQNQQVNDASQLIDNTPPHDPTEGWAPANPSEQFLYGPSDRPAEPLTAGAPFGPGPDAPTVAAPTPAQFMRQVVASMPSDVVDPEVAAFARRVAEGL